MDILTYRNYTKKEKKLFKLIIDKIKSSSNNVVQISVHELAQLNMLSLDNLLKFSHNSLIIKDDNQTLCYHLFEKVCFDNSEYIFELSKRFFKSKYALVAENIIFLQKKESIILYKYMINNDYHIILSVDECKKLLNCAGQYSRLFDFEKYMLKVIYDDFANNSDLRFSYKKIKNKIYDNSKVEFIEFFIEKEISNSNKDYIYHTKLTNPFNLQNEIYDYIEKHGITLFNEYFFSPMLFTKLLKIKKDSVVEVSENLKIFCDNKGNVRMEFYNCGDSIGDSHGE